MRTRFRILAVALLVARTLIPVVSRAVAGPNLVATNEASYQALARV